MWHSRILSKTKNYNSIFKIFCSSVVVALLFLLLTVELEIAGRSVIFNLLWDYSHVFVFMIISFSLLIVLNYRRQPIDSWSVRSFVEVLLVSSALAILTEFLQVGMRRDADLKDALLDFSGIFLVVFGLLLWKKKGVLRQKKTLKSWLRLLYIIVLLVIFVPFGYALSSNILQYLRYEKMFPLIASFEKKWELSRWATNNNATMAISDDIYSEGQASLKVSCFPSEYPGVRLKHPPRDWSGFEYFSLDIINDMKTPFSLTIKIDDDNSTNYYTRFNKLFFITPGVNHLNIFTGEILSAPSKGSLDIKKVRRVVFFCWNPNSTVTFYLDNVRLKK